MAGSKVPMEVIKEEGMYVLADVAVITFPDIIKMFEADVKKAKKIMAREEMTMKSDHVILVTHMASARTHAQAIQQAEAEYAQKEKERPPKEELVKAKAELKKKVSHFEKVCKKSLKEVAAARKRIFDSKTKACAPHIQF